MDKIQPLSLSASPEPDESMQSFFNRLAQCNSPDPAEGIEPVPADWIASAADLDFRQTQFTDAQIIRLSALSGVPFKKLRSLAPTEAREKGQWGDAVFHVLGHELPFSCLPNREGRRLCPECLKESAHHRLVWNFRFAQVCTKHQIRLISSCPECNPRAPKPLDWRVFDLTVCRDGHDLRHLVPEPVAEEEISGQRYIENILFDRPQPVPELLRGLQLSETIDVFGHLSDLPPKVRHRLLGASHKRFGQFSGAYNLGAKEPDPRIGFRLSLGLAICQLAPRKLKQALITAASSEEIWATSDLPRILTYLRSRMMTWEGKGFAIGRVVNDVLDSRGMGINW